MISQKIFTRWNFISRNINSRNCRI